MGKLLAVGTTNAKTAKNSRASAIMYLAPHIQNSKGINICPKASEGCALACLYKAGRGAFNSVQTARINKTERFLSDKQKFAEDLYAELVKLNRKAEKKAEQIAVRLNGTSDLDFIGIINRRLGVDVLDEFPHLVFYDYTKIVGKVRKYIDRSDRYRITFSRAEDNHDDAMSALKIGAPVSVVFGVQKNGNLPKMWKGYKVLDGDTSDDLMIDNKGAYVIGLRFKGSKTSMQQGVDNGFVVKI